MAGFSIYPNLGGEFVVAAIEEDGRPRPLLRTQTEQDARHWVAFLERLAAVGTRHDDRGDR